MSIMIKVINEYFVTLKEKLYQNNTVNIIKIYFGLLLKRVFPLFFTLSIFGYGNLYINFLRYILIIYIIINITINEIVLRQSIKIEIFKETVHNCKKCPTNIIFTMEEYLTNILFYVIGTFLSRHNILSNIYWKSHIHSSPLYQSNKLCVKSSLQIQNIGIFFGIVDYIVEQILIFCLPFEYCIFLTFFVSFCIDAIVYNIGPLNNENMISHNFVLKFVWNIGNSIVIGIIEKYKRNIKNTNNSIVEDIIKYLNYCRTHTYYRFIFWKEFRSLNNFISYGNSSIFYREHIINIHEFLSNMIEYLDNSMSIKIVKKTKLINISSIFRPFMSSQSKFYLELISARKHIEPFIRQIILDVESSIKSSKSDMYYEELYNVRKNIEEEKTIIKNYY